jgi:hypothetical protein
MPACPRYDELTEAYRDYVKGEHRYEPRDAPVIAGFAATLSKRVRDSAKSSSMATASRILLEDRYDPTGDKAFDLRAQTFRALLIGQVEEAYRESSDAFSLVGL